MGEKGHLLTQHHLREFSSQTLVPLTLGPEEQSIMTERACAKDYSVMIDGKQKQKEGPAETRHAHT